MTGFFFYLPGASRVIQLDKMGKQMSGETPPPSPVGGMAKDLLEVNLRGRKFMA